MAQVRLDPSFERAAARSPEVRAAVRRKAQEVAREAERNGRQVAQSYRCEVNDEGDAVQVVASTGGINAAGWIEFGTGGETPTPAYAPLRRAAEAEGLQLRNRRA